MMLEFCHPVCPFVRKHFESQIACTPIHRAHIFPQMMCAFLHIHGFLRNSTSVTANLIYFCQFWLRFVLSHLHICAAHVFHCVTLLENTVDTQFLYTSFLCIHVVVTSAKSAAPFNLVEIVSHFFRAKFYAFVQFMNKKYIYFVEYFCWQLKFTARSTGVHCHLVTYSICSCTVRMYISLYFLEYFYELFVAVIFNSQYMDTRVHIRSI